MNDPFASPEGFEPLRPDLAAAAGGSVTPKVPYPGPENFGGLYDEGLELLRRHLFTITTLSGAMLLVGFLGLVPFTSLARGSDLAVFLVVLTTITLVLTVGTTLSGVASQLWFERGSGFQVDAACVLRALTTGAIVALLTTITATPIVPIGLRVLYRLGYATTAAAHEELGPIASIKRSWTLTAKSDRFGIWFGLLCCCSLLALLPGSIAATVAGDEFAHAVRELSGVDVAFASKVLRPFSYLLLGAGIALPATVIGRFQLDLLARRDGADLRQRLDARPSPKRRPDSSVQQAGEQRVERVLEGDGTVPTDATNEVWVDRFFHGGTAGEADSARARVDEILGSDEFAEGEEPGWLADLRERIREWLRDDDSGGETFTGTRGERSSLDGLAAGVQVFSIVLLILLLVAVIVAVAKRMEARRKGAAGGLTLAERVASRVEELREQGRAAAERGDWIEALRLEFFALVVGLGERGDLEYRDAWTNRELLERGSPRPDVEAALRPVVRRLDAHSFGHVPSGPDEVREFQAFCDGLLRGGA